ncbi:hypothetical protein ABPG74_001477 [Tetrahymena malaccensis]
MIQLSGNLLKQIDIYGQSIQLSFQKKNTFNTVFGGFISFTVLCSFLVGCWFFDVRPDNLIIMMGVSDNNAQFFKDPTIFSVNAVQLTQVSVQDPHTGKQTIQLVSNTKTMKQCSMNDVQIPDLVSYFQNLNYTALYCFDSQNDEKCKNSTSSQVICKPQEVIDKTLLLTKLSIFISDHIIDPLNFVNPISNRAMTLYSSISSQSQQTFTFASYAASPLFGDPNVLMKINIRLQKLKENYMKRSYLKIADVVAQIGGLLKILIILGAFISNPIKKLQYFKAVIDEIYQFQSSSSNVRLIPKNQQLSSDQVSKEKNNQSKSILKKKQKKDNNQKRKSNSENNINLNVKIKLPQEYHKQNTAQASSLDITQPFNQLYAKKSLNNQNKNNVDKLLNKVKDYFQSTHNILKYKFINFFTHAFIPQFKWKSPNRNLLNQGIVKIQEQFDILYIFNKLLEIDKMKSILFNQDQLNLFEYMSKPTIYDQIIEEDTNILGAFKLTNNKKMIPLKISKIDENLIRFIDAEFLQQILSSKQSQQQEENEQTNISQILKSRSLSIQNIINFYTDQQSYLFDSSQNKRDEQTCYQNEILDNSQNIQNLTSSNFINYNDASYIPNIQTIKKNDNTKFIVQNKKKQQN